MYDDAVLPYEELHPRVFVVQAGDFEDGVPTAVDRESANGCGEAELRAASRSNVGLPRCRRFRKPARARYVLLRRRGSCCGAARLRARTGRSRGNLAKIDRAFFDINGT
jgi:hypothetical protein